MLSDEEIMAQVLAAFQEEEAEHRQAITDILLEIEREPNQPNWKEMIDQLFREAHSLKGGARAAGQEEVEQLAHRMEDLFSAVRAGKLELDPDVCDTIYAAVDSIGAIMSLVHKGQKPSIEPHQKVLDDLKRIIAERVQKAKAAVEEIPAPISQPAETPQDQSPPQVAAPSILPQQTESSVAPPPAVEDAAPPPAIDEHVPSPVVEEVAPPPAVAASVPTPAPEKPPVQQSATAVADTSAKASDRPPSPEGASQQDHAHIQQDPATHPTTGSGGEMPWETISTVRLATTTLDNLLNETGELITCSVRAQQRSTEARSLVDMPVRWRRIWRQIRPILTRLQNYTPASLQPTVHHLIDREQDKSFAERAAQIIEQGESVQISALTSQLAMLIDGLMQANQLIGDMEQKLSHHARQTTEDYTRLSTVTDRLHDQIRRTRMLPITTLFSPLRLQVREIARAAGKQIELELDDGGAEADRQVLERLREVLLHLLRNSIDHGIESSDVRESRGKTGTGHILLRASVSGDYLSIIVEDDGAGLDIDSIRRRALSGGLLGEADLSRVSESDMIDLIFLPGFSTRQVVSKMSGRGVGLDVVRSQVERMHGRVNVHNYPGTGCAFVISVPLSLTSSHGLLLRIDQATYMLPLDSVQRIVAVDPSDIKVLEGRACLMIDSRPLALVHLADLLGMHDTGIRDEKRATRMKGHDLIAGKTVGNNSWSLALLLGSGERQVACMVDAVLGEQELVVYRLPAPLQRVRFIGGATILADGKVVPILDVVDVVRAAIGTRYTINQTPELSTSDRLPSVLVVDDSITTRTLEKNILEAAGYQVTLATDGLEAVETLRRMIEDTGCDLLLSDIDMPRVNGFELTAQVRADQSLKHVPIVLVTSLDTPADRERGIAAGADAYIVKKAFDQQALLDTIEQLI